MTLIFALFALCPALAHDVHHDGYREHSHGPTLLDAAAPAPGDDPAAASGREMTAGTTMRSRVAGPRVTASAPDERR